jgi:transformation/transcription domain-associated protein
VEEVVQILKTAFPLLILCMETLVDQINQRFKATPEEEIYRLICMLLQDAIQVNWNVDILVLLLNILQTYVLRMNIPEDDGQLVGPTLTNLKRMANNLTGPARVRILTTTTHVFSHTLDYRRIMRTISLEAI